MPQEKIIIKFEPSGDKPLIDAIKRLAKAQAMLEGKTRELDKQTKSLIFGFRRATTETNKYSGAGARATKNTGMFAAQQKLLGGTLSVIRSKLLIYTFALTAFNKTILNAVRHAAEQEKVEAKLGQVLTATGHAAGITGTEMKALATHLSALTGVADETIIDMEAMMLTFTNIKKDVIPDTIETVLDLSAAFNQDLRQSAIQLGKALNDPAKGFTALRRIGVSFSAEQEKQIKNFMRQNDIMSAQRVILDELEFEFGGVAKNMGKTTIIMNNLSNAWGDFLEVVGTSLEPIVLPALEALTNFFRSYDSEMNKTISTMREMGFTEEDITKTHISFLEQEMVAIGMNTNELNKNITTQAEASGRLSENVDALREYSDAIKGANKDMQSHQIALNKLGVGHLVGSHNVGNMNRAIDKAGGLYNEAGKAVHPLVRLTEDLGKEKQKEALSHLVSMNAIQREKDTMVEYSDEQKEMNKLFLEWMTLQGLSLPVITTNLTVMKEWTEQWKMANSEITNAISAVDANWKAFDSAEKKKELATARTQRQKDAIEEKYAKKAEDRAKKLKAWKIASAISNVALGITQTWRDETIPTLLKVILTAAQATAGYAQIATIKGQEFEHGGLIGGRRHSQGGTMINAEAGEFVMSRSAVDSVGIENLNRMNEGGGGSAVTVNVSGNVLSQDFVEGELAENIKEAIRRGTDFGIS